MRFSPLILLPALAAAQDQVPLVDRLQGWFNQAKELLPTPKIPQAAAPIAATTPRPPKAKVAHPKTVTQFTAENYKDILSPKPDPQEWLIFVTGGNKTCFGHCGQANRSWKEAQALIPNDGPALGRVNCETQGLLCAIWSVTPPTLWHVQVPNDHLIGDQKPLTVVHPVRLNTTTVTAEEIYKVYSEKLWEKEPELQTMFHPFNGLAAEYRINELVGYIIYALGLIPSWAMMVGISFLSRTMMSRRTGRQGAPGTAAPAPAPAQ